MDEELIDQELTPQEEQDVLNAFQTIRNIILPKSKALTPKQRQALQHAAEDRRNFCGKAINYIEQDATLLPPGKDLVKVKRDRKYNFQLGGILAQAKITEELISDTQIACQTDEYSFGLATYKTAQYKAEMGVPGYDSVVADMGKLFERDGGNNEEPTPPNA
jgi:hypothetical protein